MLPGARLNLPSVLGGKLRQCCARPQQFRCIPHTLCHNVTVSAVEGCAVAPDSAPAFVSYSRANAEFALKLAEDLKNGGANVWLDQLDIEPGQRWARAVQAALNAAPRVLVILSSASVSSTNVEDEVAFSLEKRKSIIPILYQDCEVPFQLLPFQYVDFRTDYARGLGRLLRTMAAQSSQASVAPAGVAAAVVASEKEPEPGTHQAASDEAAREAAPATSQGGPRLEVEEAFRRIEASEAAEKKRLEEEATQAAEEKARREEQEESEGKAAEEKARREELLRSREIEQTRLEEEVKHRAEREQLQPAVTPIQQTPTSKRTKFPTWMRVAVLAVFVIAGWLGYRSSVGSRRSGGAPSVQDQGTSTQQPPPQPNQTTSEHGADQTGPVVPAAAPRNWNSGWFMEFTEDSQTKACQRASEPDLKNSTVLQCRYSWADSTNFQVRLGPVDDRAELDRIRKRYLDKGIFSAILRNEACVSVHPVDCRATTR